MTKQRDPNEETEYRVSAVGKTGAISTRKVKGWRKAYALYKELVSLPHIRYASVVDIGDIDIRYWKIREEWSAKREDWTAK